MNMKYNEEINKGKRITGNNTALKKFVVRASKPVADVVIPDSMEKNQSTNV